MSCNLFDRAFAINAQQVLKNLGISMLHRKPNAPAHMITGVITQPPLPEDQLPGSTAGVTNVGIWINWNAISPAVEEGDWLAINGVGYSIYRVDVDLEGGAIVYVKRDDPRPTY